MNISSLSESETTSPPSFQLKLSVLNEFMRLDSAASEAVNLLPRPDHPSVFGSLFGILNRCKLKSGSKLLERWLRQPLLDVNKINQRLDIVQIFRDCPRLRNRLSDECFKSLPDIDSIMAKMQRKSAGLSEVFRLYLFVKALPNIVSVLTDLVSESFITSLTESIRERFLVPLESSLSKLSLLRQLVEHVVDFSRLPDLEISSTHSSELQELRDEQQSLESQAEDLLKEARNDWASFANISLENSLVHRGLIFRSTKGDDERQLRANNPKVRILSILKTGLHFTTNSLESISSQLNEINAAYKEKQEAIVAKAVETAATYLPLCESTSAILSELDVLSAFATAAALAPGSYVRPTLHPLNTGKMLLRGARHPCVELMDGMSFISNYYDLERGRSAFQIVTGPNMGGKSTFIRGLGSIAVMAQVGSFVPCEEAEMSIVDAILARVGAGDAVQKGVSTFMAEMLEASVILETATSSSLLIVDELGRGTSTFDGFGLAWAISEYIVNKLNCMCLFATHFHELTSLAQQQTQGGVVNKHVTAAIQGKEVVMLYSVNEGPCLQSFGIHVAGTADFPSSVLQTAKRKAAQLEGLDWPEGEEKERIDALKSKSSISIPDKEEEKEQIGEGEEGEEGGGREYLEREAISCMAKFSSLSPPLLQESLSTPGTLKPILQDLI